MSSTPHSEPVKPGATSESAEIAVIAGGLAHEIRNPLSTIRMNLELLAEDVEGAEDPRFRRMSIKLDRIRRECLHLEEILTAFLQFARAGELQLEPVDLSKLVAEFLESYSAEAREHGILVSLHLAADLPKVCGDVRLLRNVLMNLALNAQQSMPQGGQVVFQTYRQDEHVCLAIIDTGSGISAAARDKLFQVFFSTKPTGSGLGLPTVRRIVEAHGGTIACDSEVGKGTRFVVSFPAAVEGDRAGEPEQEGPAAS